MDWVHCNKCYYQPGQQPKREFRLASCGHLFCQNCEVIGSIETCKICDAPCTVIVLEPEMRAEVQMYFEDEEEMIEKLSKVADYHKSHRQKLNEYYRTVVGKYNLLKENYYKIIKENKNLHQQNKMLNKKLEHYQHIMSTQNILTPPQSQPRHQISPLFSNNSTLASNKAFGHNNSFQSGVSSPASSLFVTPTTNYRSCRQVTPGSDISDSPGSDVGIGYRGSQSQVRRPQITRHSPGLTPPLNGLRNLSFKRRNP